MKWYNSDIQNIPENSDEYKTVLLTNLLPTITSLHQFCSNVRN